jgi:hypothetical protein
VFLIASFVEDSSWKTNRKCEKVKFANVSGCDGMREKAALNSAPYGRSTERQRTTKQKAKAGQRQGPSATGRISPLFPPTTV